MISRDFLLWFSITQFSAEMLSDAVTSVRSRSDMGLPQRDSGYHTYGEYLTWPEDERYELIDGRAYLIAPAPTLDQQEAGFIPKPDAPWRVCPVGPSLPLWICACQGKRGG